jgi:hypothetical protein
MLCSNQNVSKNVCESVCIRRSNHGGMHRKVIEIIGAAMVFTFLLIASLEINERLCFMPSIGRKAGLVFSIVVQLCSTSCHRS